MGMEIDAREAILGVVVQISNSYPCIKSESG